MAPEYYTFTGRDGEVIPQHITHVRMAKALKFVRARAIYNHPNIQVVECHDGVEKIEEWAFYWCPRLRRVIIPGVKEIGHRAFWYCTALNYIECGKLETIKSSAFSACKSLSSIELPSIKIVEGSAFKGCCNLINVKFGKDLESISEMAFYYCWSLERIALPLKDGLITAADTFQGCEKFNHVDLVGGVHETVAALLMDEWKNVLNKEIYEINRILPNTPAGYYNEEEELILGEKARAIRAWIKSVLRKYIHYKSEHRRYVEEAAATLKLTLPHEILFENILPFVELPSDTFEGEDEER